MEIKEIIRELEYFRGYYPEKALREAINHKEEIIPELIKLLERSIINIVYALESTHYLGHLHAIYLAAYFKEKSAFPLITEFFSKLEFNNFENTENREKVAFARILASVFNGEFSTLNFFSTCDKYDEYIRMAFLDTYLILFKNDKITREELIDGYRYIFENLEREKSDLWDKLVNNTNKAGITELTDNIFHAFEEGFIDSFNLPDQENIEMNTTENNNLIDDIIGITKNWYRISSKKENHGFYTGMPDTAKEIIKELEYFRGYYPAEALAKAAENKDIIIPELLKMLDWTSENPEECEDIDYIGPVLACYLLGQFQEKSAFPSIIRFITSGVYSEEAISEFVFMDLSEILASCYSGEHILLTEIILNKEVAIDIRAASLECFIILYRYNDINMKEYFEILKMLFANLEKDAEPVWNKMIEACKMAQAREFYPEIELAYQAGLVDEFALPFEKTRILVNSLNGQAPDLKWINKFKAEIDTTDWWTCIELDEFNEIELSYQERKEYFFKSKSNDTKKENFHDKYNYESSQPMQPYVRTGKKIGRNDPCPCGSGKKYKKCCGKNKYE